MDEKISVIVPVYNVEQYLERCVDSIINQTYKNLEIILVNDGSTDNSGQLCDELAKKDDRIRVIHKKNGGLSDARNKGEESSTGDYIIFIDSDDYIHIDMINSLYIQIKSVGADVSVCGVMNVYSNSETPQCSNTQLVFSCDREGFLKEYLVGEKIPGGIWNKLIKKSISENIKFPFGLIYEDAYYQYELLKHCEKYVVNTLPYYYYFHRENSITTRPYSSKDLVYVEIYRRYYELVKEQYPTLEEEAFFRVAYAYFFILDKMLLQDDYKKIEEYNEIVGFLKKNAFKISRNRIFRIGRRIAALTLLINIKLYRILLFKNIKNSKKVHD